MATYAESQLRQSQKKVVDIQKKIAGVASKIGGVHKKLSAARGSTSKSAPTQVAKYQKEISSLEGNRAKLEVRLATAQEQSHKYSAKVADEAATQSKKDAVKESKRLAAEKAAWKLDRDNLEAQLQSVSDVSACGSK